MNFCRECRRNVPTGSLVVVSVARNGLRRTACADCAAQLRQMRKEFLTRQKAQRKKQT